MDTEPVLISIAEFCRLYGICRTKTYALISAGQIEKAKIGSRTLITTESAKAFAKRAIVGGEK
ncbi:MAG: excisionase [Sphingobium sp.]|nr:excisionase [Sphingobium sp.]